MMQPLRQACVFASRAGVVAGLAGLVTLVLACSAPAQPAPAVVKARMVLATNAVHPGMTAHAAVEAQIMPGYHINDHHPSLNYLIPTEVTFEPGKIFQVEKITYPAGRIENFAFSSTGLSVYEGRLVIGVLLKVASGIPMDDYPLRGMLEYQACNDHACLPPARVPLRLKVKVAGSSVTLRRTDADVFGKARSE